MKTRPTLFKLAIAFCCAIVFQTVIVAQDIQESQKAMALVKKNAAAIGLSNDDITNSRISSTYDDALSGTTLVYLQQTYKGIDVDKTIKVLAFKNGTLVSSSGSRIDLSRSTIATSPTLQKKPVTPAVTAEGAIQAAAQHLHLPAPSMTSRPAVGQDFSKPVDYGDLGIAKENVTVRLVWVPQKTFERIKLAWEVNVSPKKTPDSWRVIVDANKGDVIRKDNYTDPDSWDKENKQPGNGNKIEGAPSAAPDTSGEESQQGNTNASLEGVTSVTYQVVPFPAEAPSFPNGAPSLVTNPWKLSPAGSGATPFIWNDDGNKQYKFTRGNNVLAQEDRNADDSDGKRAWGIDLNNHLYFVSNPDFNKQPTTPPNQKLAITNLFYWNNIMHDLSYQYGFDEQSGNFQQNNLGRGGEGHDYVYADAQDGSGLNNANFNTPPDGQHPRMQMYLFTGDPSKTMKVNTPASIAGNVVAIEGAVSPNNMLTNVGPVTGDVALYDEAADTLHNACSPASNSGALSGKIALLRRGTCLFVDKILNAQNAGAIAVIVIDSVPGEFPITMSGNEPSIVIPAVMISYEDGVKIRAVLDSSTAVNVTLTAPPYLDGDLDNGVICHEYTHGISNRLTGGPANVSCLDNAEEAGEGWSDYISLMTVTDWSKAHVNDGNKAKGIGTYVLSQPTDGPGIRTYPYSVDTSIDPHTYADIANVSGEVHYIGEIWASTLWDMTWFIIQQDGINKDIFNAQGEGGNSVAYKLVMTGMKLQPCSPGFIDGRNAILKADTLLYGGKYSCAIWKAFARRGMGIGASQGSSDVAGDETVDFTESGIFITKHADKNSVQTGADLNYSIKLKALACNGNVEQNYAVTDSLPGNVTYVSSDGTYNSSNRTITFSNINMNGGDSLTYKVKVRVKQNTAFPDSVYINDSVNTPVISDAWVAKNGKHLSWGILNLGIYFYYSNDDSVRDAERLVTAQKYFVPGTSTTFSFFHEVASDDFKNGGVVEITTDGGNTWEDLGPYMSGFVYNETITGNSVLNGRKAFSGFGFGTTSIDLSSFAGKTVKVRFRYATSDSSFAVPDGGTGWIIDDIVLSATANVTNTAKLYNQNGELKGHSTAVTKIGGGNTFNDFIAVNRNNTDALLNWHTPGELNGTYKIERSVDKGVTFKEIGTVNTLGEKANRQSYNFTDASPAEGVNLYRIHHISSNGVVDYTDIKLLTFNNTKAVQVSPNPAKERLRVSIPGNAKAVTLRLTDGSGKEIKNYKESGQIIELGLPMLPAGVYYLNVIKADGTTSQHKVVIE
jgi:extracellular elastinolytic metalloproteinase